MKIQAPKKRITLDELAEKMAEGFKRVDANFKRVDANFKRVDANFKRVDANHESLARMVAKGFEDTATKQDVANLNIKIDGVKKELKEEMQGLRGSVNNYLQLSDKRYLELKNNQKILAKYIKLVFQKSSIPVDLTELDIVLK